MGVLDLVFPVECLACRKPGRYICPVCLSKVMRPGNICPVCRGTSFWGSSHFNCAKSSDMAGLSSLWRYEGVVKKAILALKYRFASKIADELALCAAERLKKESLRVYRNATLVAVPSHWYRTNWRGFNQAEVIGKCLAGYMGWDFIPNVLKKSRASPPQTGLPGELRVRNVKGTYEFNAAKAFPVKTGRNFLVFDDVWTTGSTMKEAARVLKEEGAGRVWGITLCRGN